MKCAHVVAFVQKVRNEWLNMTYPSFFFFFGNI